jgi:hypothetical protein
MDALVARVGLASSRLSCVSVQRGRVGRVLPTVAVISFHEWNKW